MRVMLVMASTINGKIARSHHELVDWTSPEDKMFFARKTKEAGAIIMGKRTYDTIGRPLRGRLNVVLTRTPERQKSKPGVLEFTKAPLRALLKKLEKRGYRFVVLAGGAEVNSRFLKANLIDEIFLSIEPKIFGKGVGIFQEVGCYKELELLDVQTLSPTTLNLHYKVLHS